MVVALPRQLNCDFPKKHMQVVTQMKWLATHMYHVTQLYNFDFCLIIHLSIKTVNTVFVLPSKEDKTVDRQLDCEKLCVYICNLFT